MVQVNFSTGPSHIPVFFLPYSIGAVWCYAKQQPKVKVACDLKDIIWRHEPIEKLAKQLSESEVVCFSTYVWNRKYHYAVASAIKRLNPDTLIIFGGPEPPITDPEIFQKHPYIDLAVKGEGEIVFASVLEALADRIGFEGVPGLVINRNGMPLSTGDCPRIADLSILPSPYLMGFFDDMITNNPDISWTATLETNRGCPYQCTFCDWGSLTYSKVKQFPMKRVLDELDWFGSNCDGIYCADANFAMFYDRDRQVVDRLIEVKRRSKRLNFWFVNWAKNHKQNVIDLIRKLNDEPDLITNGLTVSTQSMTPEVLDIIKRKNLKQHALEEIFDLTNRYNIPVYTELILGLPGETTSSWKKSVFDIFKAGNHHSIDFNQCQILENSELNLVQREIYQIGTSEWYDIYGPKRSKFDFTLPDESISVTVSTSTMSYAQIQELNVWNNFINTMHIFGYSSIIARFLWRRFDIEFEQFYEGMYAELHKQTWFSNVLADIAKIYDEINKYGRLQIQIVPEIDTNAIFISHLLSMKIAAERKQLELVGWIAQYVQKKYPQLDPYVESLFLFQKNSVACWPKICDGTPIIQHSPFDYHGYLDHGQVLDTPVCYKISTRSVHRELSFQQYVEYIYFRRRHKIGQMQISVC
jgi:putative methyltransferase